ncbi:hypothetical protein [Burkholderia sp. L27(2015)]|uniref:hypothetical protein n=1 Tax=Burkholderia sp. L27(2015) TaxID=1641858 RepID=UPI00131D769B|nr:hypothetical protein [Burkholderia sp. L27(2015)]
MTEDCRVYGEIEVDTPQWDAYLSEQSLRSNGGDQIKLNSIQPKRSSFVCRRLFFHLFSTHRLSLQTPVHSDAIERLAKCCMGMARAVFRRKQQELTGQVQLIKNKLCSMNMAGK